jgi:hypothetical protein
MFSSLSHPIRERLQMLLADCSLAAAAVFCIAMQTLIRPITTPAA